MTTTPQIIQLQNLTDTASLKKIAGQDLPDYVVLYTGDTGLHLAPYAMDRMSQAVRMADAVMLYADYVRTAGGVGKNIPVLEYQPGSLRDDFDFGPLQLYRTREFVEAVNEMDENYRYAA